eukprot:g8733.t1
MAGLVVDLTGVDDDGVACQKCTFINFSLLKNCELCGASLENNIEQNAAGESVGKNGHQSQNQFKPYQQQCVNSLKNKSPTRHYECQGIGAGQGSMQYNKRKREGDLSKDMNTTKMKFSDKKLNYKHSIPFFPYMVTIIDSSISLNFVSPLKSGISYQVRNDTKEGNDNNVKPNIKNINVNFDVENDAIDNFKDDMDGVVPGENLGSDQKTGFNLCKQGHNVFITGVAGTGKSWLLKHIIKYFKKIEKRVAVMAPTGIAAVNVGGCTLHSFCGIGIPKGPNDFLKMSNKGPANRILKSQVWIIDEISMCSGELLDKIEARMRVIRQNNLPFGGVQMIFCGDFLQLPPVENALNPVLLRDAKDANDIFLNRGMAFQSEVWKIANFHTVRLRKVYRQGDDRDMVLALQDLRLGIISPGIQRLVNETKRQLRAKDGIEPTKLYCKNLDVDLINEAKLGQLTGDATVYDKYDEVLPDPRLPRALTRSENQLLSKFFDQVRVKAQVKLKIGAQVMCLQNDITRVKLVNGSRGVVIGFKTWIDTFISLKHEKDIAPDEIRPLIGLKITWLHQVFEGNGVPNYKHTTFFPVVKFESGREYIMSPVEFSSEIDKLGKAARIQVPLKLAWAITIHKSQGMSIDRLVINVGDCFAAGQAYVALSRATSKDGLQIQGFTNRCVLTSELALKFEELSQVAPPDTIIPYADNSCNSDHIGGKDSVITTWLTEARRKWGEIRDDVLNSYAAQELREYPKCSCNVRSKRLQVRKAGRNQGKYFFTCHKNYKDKDKCNFFLWDLEEEVRGDQ